MNNYKTYVMGEDAALFFDRDLLDNLKNYATIFWKMSWRYYSIWRVLHIDNLEGCDADGRKPPCIPFCQRPTTRYQFFTYATKEVKE